MIRRDETIISEFLPMQPTLDDAFRVSILSYDLTRASHTSKLLELGHNQILSGKWLLEKI